MNSDKKFDPPITLFFFTRPDCPLCDRGLEILRPLAQRHGLALEKVNIETDVALEAQYGERIPVVTLGDTEVAWGRISERGFPRQLEKALTASR